MKITPQQIKLVARLYREQKQVGPRQADTESGVPLDKVTISEQSQELQMIISELKTIPEIRNEKVAELRAAIRNGTYQVSGEAVAEKLLEQILDDDVFREDVDV